MNREKTITVEVPVTMRIAVTFPEGAPPDAAAAAAELADWAAGKLAHVTHAQIDACNELNRLFPHHAGVVAAVDAHVFPTGEKVAA